MFKRHSDLEFVTVSSRVLLERQVNWVDKEEMDCR